MASSRALMAALLLSQCFVGVFCVVEDCAASDRSPCNNRKQALPLKIIAIAAILVASIIGVSLPLVTRAVPALNPERTLFIVVKAFASGIILATGFMHVLPDSFEMLLSPCLPDQPWHKFPFTGFVAMLSAIVTLMIDSVATSLYSKHKGDVAVTEAEKGDSVEANQHHSHHGMNPNNAQGSQLLRYRVIAMVLELGIVVHSVVIGLSLGASSNTCSIKGLIAALCFHQLFEGMGLGGCILQAEYGLIKKATMAFFFSVTMPFGITLGIALSSSYRENSPRALITTGLLSASSSGLLIYMALVDLLASEFMGKRLQESIKLQVKCFVAVLVGAGGMSLMAKWS